MEFKAIVDAKARDPSGCAVVGVYEDGELGVAARQLDAQIGGLIAQLHARGRFCRQTRRHAAVAAARGRRIRPGAAGRARCAQPASGASNIARPCNRALRRSSRPARAMRSCIWRSRKCRASRLPTAPASVAEVVLRANLQDSRPEDRRKAEAGQARAASPWPPTTRARPRPWRTGLKIGAAIGSGLAFVARSGEPAAQHLHADLPRASARRRSAKEWPRVKTKVLDEAGIKALKMGAFLAVTQGSDAAAAAHRLRISRRAERTARRCAWSARASPSIPAASRSRIRPAMDEMKFDMSGAATVLGALRTRRRARACPSTWSASSPPARTCRAARAVKPADIVTTMSGQTVEILNTDAEGRLVLCDAITYSRRFKPAAVVDVATLTGACIIALGNHFSGLMSNDEALAERAARGGHPRRRPRLAAADRRGVRASSSRAISRISPTSAAARAAPAPRPRSCRSSPRI